MLASSRLLTDTDLEKLPTLGYGIWYDDQRNFIRSLTDTFTGWKFSGSNGSATASSDGGQEGGSTHAENASLRQMGSVFQLPKTRPWAAALQVTFTTPPTAGQVAFAGLVDPSTNNGVMLGTRFDVSATKLVFASGDQWTGTPGVTVDFTATAINADLLSHTIVFWFDGATLNVYLDGALVHTAAVAALGKMTNTRKGVGVQENTGARCLLSQVMIAYMQPA